MNLFSAPISGLSGVVSLPGDKSLSHRAILIASLAQGDSQIENFQVSGVTRVMLEAIEMLGVRWELEGSTLTVHGRGINGWHNPAQPIHCGNSATTMRLLAGALSICGVTATLDGSSGLRNRPMDRIVDPLQQMGVPVQATSGKAPLRFTRPSYPLKGLLHTLPVASAQVKTCLLLAGLVAGEPTTLVEPGPSRDHTERLFRQQGFDVQSQAILENGDRIYQTRLAPPQRLVFSPLQMQLPGDFSSAAFLIVAGLVVPGSLVELRNVGLNPTRTGLLDALLAMGADIQILAQDVQGGEPTGTLLVKNSKLKGIEIHGDLVVRMIDEFPIFAVAAACAQGSTIVRDSTELRHKESDRIGCLAAELQKLGVSIEEQEDGFAIEGCGGLPHGGLVQTHGDHRLSMALTVAGLAAPGPVLVQDGNIYRESFPEFVRILNRLGAGIREESA